MLFSKYDDEIQLVAGDESFQSAKDTGRNQIVPINFYEGDPQQGKSGVGTAATVSKSENQMPVYTSQIDLDGLATHEFDKHQMLEAFEMDRLKHQVALSWHNVEISVKPERQGCLSRRPPAPKRKVLDKVSGYALPGDFISIIGASGAGKTTLLNHLSGRLLSKNLEIAGDVKINGQLKRDVKNVKEVIAYVQQDDILFQSLTVRECMEFSAKLRMKGTDYDRKKRVDHLISALKLQKCQNTQIGGPIIKGVSGGERKRTSIAVELLMEPSLIFLDEPTTGLDSFTATQVIGILRNLAQNGRTVIQTIHQPNSEIFEFFHKLMLITDGKTIFFDGKDNAVGYFKSIGFACPEFTNPADYFLNFMSIESIEMEDVDRKNKVAYANALMKVESTYQARVRHFIESYEMSDMSVDPEQFVTGMKKIEIDDDDYNLSWCEELGILCWRNMVNLARIPLFGILRIMAAILVAFIIYAIYFNLDGTKVGVQDRVGALVFIVLTAGFTCMQAGASIFPMEKPIFQREVSNGMYRVSSYFWSKVVSDAPLLVIQMIAMNLLSYYLIGLNTASYEKPLIFFLATLRGGYGITALGYLLGGATSDLEVSNAIAPVLLVPQLLFAGFFVNQDNVPAVLSPLKNIALYKYTF